MKRICNLIKKRGTFSLAYTLAEVVIVMLVIAVVAGVSIKITKAKLDNIISYTYYMGYSTLRNVTGQMLGDFKSTDDDYMQTAYRFPKFIPSFLIQENKSIAVTKYYCAEEAFASNYMDCSVVGGGCVLPQQHQQLYDTPNISCASMRRWYQFSDSKWNGTSMKNYNFAICPGKYAAFTEDTKKYWDYASFTDTYYLVGIGGVDGECTEACGDGTNNCGRYRGVNYPARFMCSFTGTYNGKNAERQGQFYSTDKGLSKWPICMADFDDTPEQPTCTEPSQATKDAQYCQGKEWSSEICNWKDITPWPPCNQEGSRWSKTSCACVPETPTLPRKGANFCEKFLDYTNTKSTAEECNGDAIASNLTDFTDKKADIVLRNGLKLYNVRQNPAPLPLLAGNNQGGSYELADGTTVNVNEFGYTVYLDIDGEKGSSTLWEDVFPFYITMAGKVIPLYHTEGEKEYGGTSRQHLMTSVQKEVITTTGHRQVLWIRKSVPFKESACTSGYINSTTPYCSGVSLEPTCNEGANVCILKYVSPVKFF